MTQPTLHYAGPKVLSENGTKFDLALSMTDVTIPYGRGTLSVRVPNSAIFQTNGGPRICLPDPSNPSRGVSVSLNEGVLDLDYPVNKLLSGGALALCYVSGWLIPLLVVPGDSRHDRTSEVWGAWCPRALGAVSVAARSITYKPSTSPWVKSKKSTPKTDNSPLASLPLMALPDFKPRTIALAVGGQLVRSVADSLVASVIPAMKRQITDQLWSSLSVDRTLSASIQFLDGFVKWYTDVVGDRFQHQFESSGYGEQIELAPAAPPTGRVLWFFWNKRLYWATITGNESFIGCIKTMTLCTYGRSNKPLTDFVQAVVQYYRRKTEVATTSEGIPLIRVNRLRSGSDWMNHVSPGRELSTIVYDDLVQEKLFDRIAWWMENKPWYNARGISYKYTAMLHGVAGTGKTSLSKVIATMYKRDIYSINLSLIESDAQLYDVFSCIPAGSIIIMDEVDSCDAVLSREAAMARKQAADRAAEDSGLPPNEYFNLKSRFNLSALLDIMDGLVPLDNMIILMTTNRLADLDQALVREGRTDEIIEVKPVGDTQVRKYIKLVYPDADLSVYRGKFAPVTGSHLQGLFYANPNDEKAFIESIPTLDESEVSE